MRRRDKNVPEIASARFDVSPSAEHAERYYRFVTSGLQNASSKNITNNSCVLTASVIHYGRR